MKLATAEKEKAYFLDRTLKLEEEKHEYFKVNETNGISTNIYYHMIITVQF